MTITIPIGFIWSICIVTALVIFGFAIFGAYILWMLMKSDGNLGWYK